MALGAAPTEAKVRKQEKSAESVARFAGATTPTGTVGAWTPKQRTLSFTFKQLGAATPIQMRGVEGYATLPFSIRSDEVVVAAKLKIDYAYSPALIAELSQLKVMLNGEVASVLPLPREKGMGNTREINLDSRLFSDNNQLQFVLLGHYTNRCEDPMHSSLWLSLSNLGRLELTLAPLSLTNDLKYLPVPFFDKLDNSALKLPFVFASAPSFGTLKAAGIVASWFGGLADYRGAQFPVMLNALPEGNAVVFLQGNEKIGALGGPVGPTISIEPHPTNPNAKLLLLTGMNDEDLQRVARAVVLNKGVLSGQQVSVTKDVEPASRKPYDAPAWVPTNRPVRFAELARFEELKVKGYSPDAIRVNFRVAPDLFTWRSAGVPVDLKYRFTPLSFNKNSSLNVNINDNFVNGLALLDQSNKIAGKDMLKLPFQNKDPALQEAVLLLPPYQIRERNQLQFQYYFDIAKEGDCRDALPDNLRGAIDPESTIDFSNFPHYSALPNLAVFSNLGFPYTRMADLSETAVVMTERPNADEIGAYLALLGRMGEATLYPALRHVIVPASQIDKVAERDLIVIGSGENQSLMTKWSEYLPLVQINGDRRVRVPDVFRRVFYRWGDEDVQPLSRPDGSLVLKGGGDLTALMAFESPLKAKRSVVFLYADKSDDLHKIGDALSDPERLSNVRDDFVLIDENGVSHAKVADTYYVGSLPWTTQLLWVFSKNPLLLALLVIVSCILLAVTMFRALRRIAAKRLQTKGSQAT